jgi:hypothetical protein
MKQILLFALASIYLLPIAQAQNPVTHTYNYGDYRLETGYCDYNSKLEVFHKDKSVTKFCNGEGGGYILADTLNLNNDNRPDFICSHMQEDGYSYIVLLVSENETYRFVDPDIYCSDLITREIVHPEDDEYLKEFAVVDVDSDGKPEVLLNVLEKDGQIVPLAVRGTDTLSYEWLQYHITEFDTNSYWLPEKYVEAVAAGDTLNASDYLFPVAAYFDPFGRCTVLTYKAEPFPQLMRKTTINGVTKYRLEHLHYKINLGTKPPAKGNEYVSMSKTRPWPMVPVYDQLERSVITIMKRGEKLLMEITDAAGVEQIYFIDRYKGKKLTPEIFPVRYNNYTRR